MELHTRFPKFGDAFGLSHVLPFIHVHIFAGPGIIACPTTLDSCAVLAYFHQASFRIIFRLIPCRGDCLLASDAYAPVMEVVASIEIKIVTGSDNV